MLGMIGQRLVHQDRMLGAAKQSPGTVKNAGARAAGPDIDGTSKRHSIGFCILSPTAPASEHVVEDSVRIERRKRRCEIVFGGMRAAGESEHSHARRLGGLDAGRAVLDDQAGSGRNAHLAAA